MRLQTDLTLLIYMTYIPSFAVMTVMLEICIWHYLECFMDQTVTGFVWLTLSSIYKQSIICTLRMPTAQALAMVLNYFYQGNSREVP